MFDVIGLVTLWFIAAQKMKFSLRFLRKWHQIWWEKKLHILYGVLHYLEIEKYTHTLSRNVMVHWEKRWRRKTWCFRRIRCMLQSSFFVPRENTSGAGKIWCAERYRLYDERLQMWRCIQEMYGWCSNCEYISLK